MNIVLHARAPSPEKRYLVHVRFGMKKKKKRKGTEKIYTLATTTTSKALEVFFFNEELVRVCVLKAPPAAIAMDRAADLLRADYCLAIT